MFKTIGIGTGSCSTLVITEKSVYHIDVDGGNITVEKLKEKKAAVGSGAAAALLSMNLFDQPADVAVVYSIFADKASGGNVNGCDLSDESFGGRMFTVTPEDQKKVLALFDKSKVKKQVAK